MLVVASLCMRIAWASVIPTDQAPDEPAHVRYVEYVAEHLRLPVQPPTELRRLIERWEQFFQPPLAYVLFAPLTMLMRAIGASHDQLVWTLRLQNAGYGAATVAVSFWIIARLTPQADPRRWLVAIFVAFLPGWVGNTAAVNNDGVAGLLAAALWLPLLAPRGKTRPWLTGAILGLGCLAKLTVMTIAPIVLLVPWLRGDPIRKSVRDLVIVASAAGLVVAPWMIRNLLLYREPFGTITAFISFDSMVGILPPDLLAAAAAPQPLKMFLQFWGRVGRHNNIDWIAVPAVWIPVALVGVTGWLRRPGRPPDALEGHAPAFLLAIALATVALLIFSFRYYSGWQGRHFYCVLVPICALLASGWARWAAAPRLWFAVAALALVLLALDASLAWKLLHFFGTTHPVRWTLRSHL
jgi:hypothetical protein